MTSPAEPRDGSYPVPAGTKRVPLDRVVKDVLGVSWLTARKLIETGKITVDGKVVRETLKYVSEGATLELSMRARRPSTEARLDSDVIAFADAHLVVVRKPPGVSTVPFEEGERGTLDQLVRALLTRGRKSRGGSGAEATLGVVHRLDKETSGLLVFARSLAAKKHLAQQFRVHSVHRRYLAIAHGDVQSRTIESRLVADRGDGLRGSTHLPNQGQIAITHVERLERLNGATLIACRLETGRTHQIRVHLSESGHPLVGERVYIRNYRGAHLPAPRIMLHAAELGFLHPTNEREMSFEEPLPADMQSVLESLRG
jgi:23S rRNA pseudouridine1911/1915/1917 synthase